MEDFEVARRRLKKRPNKAPEPSHDLSRLLQSQESRQVASWLIFDVRQRMTRVFQFLIVCFVALTGCGTPSTLPTFWHEGAFYLKIASGHTSAGASQVWLVNPTALSVRIENGSETSGQIVFERKISRSERRALVTSIEHSGLLAKLGQDISPPTVDAPVITLSDFSFIIFAFRDGGTAEEVRASTVVYIGGTDES